MHKIWITKIAYTPKIYGLDTKTSPIFKRAYLFQGQSLSGHPWCHHEGLKFPLEGIIPMDLGLQLLELFSVTKSFNDM